MTGIFRSSSDFEGLKIMSIQGFLDHFRSGRTKVGGAPAEVARGYEMVCYAEGILDKDMADAAAEKYNATRGCDILALEPFSPPPDKLKGSRFRSYHVPSEFAQAFRKVMSQAENAGQDPDIYEIVALSADIDPMVLKIVGERYGAKPTGLSLMDSFARVGRSARGTSEGNTCILFAVPKEHRDEFVSEVKLGGQFSLKFTYSK